jgi:hypothetical protein
LKRVYVVCQLPNSAGKSRHGEPVRTIHNTASKNRRLSCAVAPGSPDFPGNWGFQFYPLVVSQQPSAFPHLRYPVIQIPNVNTFLLIVNRP